MSSITNNELKEYFPDHSVETISLICQEAQRDNAKIHFDRGQKKVSIILKESLLGKGSTKSVYASKTIELLPVKQPSFSSVLAYPEEFNLFSTGNDIHLRIYTLFLKEKPAGVFLMEPYTRVDQACYTRRQYKENLKNVRGDEGLRCLKDIAKSVAWIHSQGFIHGDLKEDNVAVDEARRAQLDDFDYAGEIGTYEDLASSVQRPGTDPLMKFTGLRTPYFDWYRLISLYCSRLMGDLLPYIEVCKVRDAVFREMRHESSHYWTSAFPFENLSEKEKRLFTLFIDICKESTKLYCAVNCMEKEKVSAAIQAAPIRAIEARCLALAEEIN